MKDLRKRKVLFRYSIPGMPESSAEYLESIRRTLPRLMERDLGSTRFPVAPDGFAVKIMISREIPVNMSEKRKAKAEEGELAMTMKPDPSQIAGTILRAMKGTLYRSPGKVTTLLVEKRFVKGPSSVDVTVGWWEDL